MKFPYGLADFQALIRGQYLYLDRTGYIPVFEDLGSSLLFVRPRRFGKSLWLKTLAAWYDVRTAEHHNELFGHLEAGRGASSSAHRYFVLSWNFSKVPTPGSGLVRTVEEVGARLESYINSTLEIFSFEYARYLPAPFAATGHPLENLNRLLALVRATPYRLCLLIDEYDNFANELMMQDGEAYQRLVGADGPFKHIMKWVKAATEGEGLERLLMTGVTPVALADLSSGLNMVKNVSQATVLNSLCGFTEAELAEVLSQLTEHSRGSFNPSEALEMMRVWYNGYRFAPNANGKVYNPTLALYFLDHLQREGTYPGQMLDSNLMADESKLKFLAHGTASGEILAETLQSGRPIEISQVEDSLHYSDFALQKSPKRSTVVSFLYYFGMLTIENVTNRRTLNLAPPNLVIQKLYVEEMLRWFLEEDSTSSDIEQPARELMSHGRIEPLLNQIETSLLPRFSARDQRWMNELAIKTAFLTLLFQATNYRLLSEPVVHYPDEGLKDGSEEEPDARYGFADLVLLVRPDARNRGLFDLLLELKWIRPEKLGGLAPRLDVLSREELAQLEPIRSALDQAEEQARRYRTGLLEKFGKDVLQLRAWAVVAIGLKRLVAREVG